MLGLTFPLIPLPIKEAVFLHEEVEEVVSACERVSINSTSYKGSGLIPHVWVKKRGLFPLIPLPIKEAVYIHFTEESVIKLFPLIPLPIKEAVFACLLDETLDRDCFH